MLKEGPTMKKYEKDYEKLVKQRTEKQSRQKADKIIIRKYSRLSPVEISYSNRLEAIKKTVL